METIQIEISRELAEAYMALHERLAPGSTATRSLEEFATKFVEDRFADEIQFIGRELEACA